MSFFVSFLSGLSSASITANYYICDIKLRIYTHIWLAMRSFVAYIQIYYFFSIIRILVINYNSLSSILINSNSLRIKSTKKNPAQKNRI